MRWRKIGRIFEPASDYPWMKTHAMVPVADHLHDSIFRVYLSGRDDQNRSLIGYFELDIEKPNEITAVSSDPVLGIGELGCFDDNGVTPSWIVDDGDTKLLYYIGWRPRSTTRMSVIAGLAESLDGGDSFTRVSRAPILLPNDREPMSILTAPCVLREGDRWRMWYVSGVEWLSPDLPRYNIKYAESDNGRTWNQSGQVCIDFRDNDETALARPCVVKDNGLYRMWYSYKPVQSDKAYKIGYAESPDGMEWERMDDAAGIDTSEEGWDSQMVEYACVVRHRERWYMFYNGNEYGMTGIGLAVAEPA
jgi:predicted GH43/DUF377 family glycosyl hydrolase